MNGSDETGHLYVYVHVHGKQKNIFGSEMKGKAAKVVALHCKKRLLIFRLQRGCHFPSSPWPGIINLFPASGSLVSDIPSGDGKTANHFLQCGYCFTSIYFMKPDGSDRQFSCIQNPQRISVLYTNTTVILKLLRSSGIDSKELIPPAYVA